MKQETKDKLRQLYNHANVLHNVAWEARFAYDEMALGLLKKAKTVEEFEKLKTEIYNTIRHDIGRLPEYPRPNRPTSHSGDVDTISFWAYDMKRQLEEKNKSK